MAVRARGSAAPPKSAHHAQRLPHQDRVATVADRKPFIGLPGDVERLYEFTAAEMRVEEAEQDMRFFEARLRMVQQVPRARKRLQRSTRRSIRRAPSAPARGPYRVRIQPVAPDPRRQVAGRDEALLEKVGRFDDRAARRGGFACSKPVQCCRSVPFGFVAMTGQDFRPRVLNFDAPEHLRDARVQSHALIRCEARVGSVLIEPMPKRIGRVSRDRLRAQDVGRHQLGEHLLDVGRRRTRDDRRGIVSETSPERRADLRHLLCRAEFVDLLDQHAAKSPRGVR